MSKSGSYSCKSCRQNPIFRSFLLKKFFQKNFFCSKKIKKSKLTNFWFQLDRKLGFRVRGKTSKLRKQVELGHRDVSTCLLVVPTIQSVVTMLAARRQLDALKVTTPFYTWTNWILLKIFTQDRENIFNRVQFVQV